MWNYRLYCIGRITSPEDKSIDEVKPISQMNAAAEVSGNYSTDTIPAFLKDSVAESASAFASSSLDGLDFNQFSKTYAVLAQALRYETPIDQKRGYDEPLQTSDLDAAIAPLFAYVIGCGDRDAIDFKAIKAQVTALHSGVMTDFVSSRIDIIERYVYGTPFDDLRFSINNTYQFAEENHLPGWILFDILIDNRNIDAMTVEKLRFDETSSEILERLGKIKENYYPAIDRLEAEINRKCLDEQFRQKTKKVGSIVFAERLWGMYSLIKTFVIAVCNGSLFQTFYTATRLEKLLYSYLLKYSNREFFVEYVRVKLVSLNAPNELEAVVRERLGNDFNALEAKSIWNSVCNLPEYHGKTITKYKAIQLLWDYFDDETFAQVSQWLLEKYSDMVCDKNGMDIKMGEENLYETLYVIAPRLAKEKKYSIIENTPIKMWHRASGQWLLKIWFQILDGELVDSDELISFSKTLISIHDASFVKLNRTDFLNVAIQLVLCDKVENEKLSFFKAFLERNYPEVITDYTNPDYEARISLRLDKIENRMTIIRVSLADIVPYIEILNIISASSYKEIPKAIAERIYQTAVSTIYTENEYVGNNERLTALKILIVLVGRYGHNKELLKQAISIFPQTYGYNGFSTDSRKAVIAGIYLLKATLGTIRPEELRLLFPNINDDANVAETINVIRYWVCFCGKITKPSFIETTIQYVVTQLLGNDQSSIRRIAGLMLVELSETKFDKLALDRISQIIDSGVPETGAEVEIGLPHADKSTKEVIISALNQFRRKNPKQVGYILAKAQADTSWSVRNAARNVEDMG